MSLTYPSTDYVCEESFWKKSALILLISTDELSDETSRWCRQSGVSFASAIWKTHDFDQGRYFENFVDLFFKLIF